MRLDLIDRPYVYFIALLIVAWLTSGAMAVRSVSRIWLRHWNMKRYEFTLGIVHSRRKRIFLHNARIVD